MLGKNLDLSNGSCALFLGRANVPTHLRTLLARQRLAALAAGQYIDQPVFSFDGSPMTRGAVAPSPHSSCGPARPRSSTPR
jgi:hypothetical protein